MKTSLLGRAVRIGVYLILLVSAGTTLLYGNNLWARAQTENLPSWVAWLALATFTVRVCVCVCMPATAFVLRKSSELKISDLAVDIHTMLFFFVGKMVCMYLMHKINLSHKIMKPLKVCVC